MWYEIFVCGRQANVLVARLGGFITSTKGQQPLDSRLRETLIQLLDRVRSGAPVVVNSRVLTTWICFTDGACEDRASVGAMLVNPLGQAISVFGDNLPSELQHLFYGESKHPIYETELLPVLISVLVWGEMIQGSQVVFYLDTESAKSGLIKGYGATKVANAIVGSFCQTEALLQLKTWFSRVPTHSNPSDGPSRMCFGLANSLGCTAFGAMVKGQRTHLVTPGQTWGYGGACVIFPHLLWKKECFRNLVLKAVVFVFCLAEIFTTNFFCANNF